MPMVTMNMATMLKYTCKHSWESSNTYNSNYILTAVMSMMTMLMAAVLSHACNYSSGSSFIYSSSAQGDNAHGCNLQVRMTMFLREQHYLLQQLLFVSMPMMTMPMAAMLLYAFTCCYLWGQCYVITVEMPIVIFPMTGMLRCASKYYS